MSFILTPESLANCANVDPVMIQLAQRAAELSTQEFQIFGNQSRTLAQEEKLVAEHVSETLHSHHIIDCEGPGKWAAPGKSGAIDAVPVVNGQPSWDWQYIYPVAAAFLQASKELGIPETWGGYWSCLSTEIPGDGSAAALETAQKGPHGGFDGPHHEKDRND